MITVRLSARDRALLDRLVAQEAPGLEARGVEATAASVVRQLIRRAARTRGVTVSDDDVAEVNTPNLPRAIATVAADRVRTLLERRCSERRGLAAELARVLDVEPAQVSRFRSGKAGFPQAKLDALFALLRSKGTER